MSLTPSKLRRRGREDFIIGEKPEDHSPWKWGTFEHHSNYKHWLEGWKEGEAEWEEERKQREEEMEEERFKEAPLEYPERHQQGYIFIEHNLNRGVKYGDLGIQVGPDGRVWICIDGKALIRFTPGERRREDGIKEE